MAVKPSQNDSRTQVRMRARRLRFRRFFAYLGYSLVAAILAISLLEFGAFLVLSAYHRLRPDADGFFADASPAYAGYPWAPDFWKEETSRWKLARGSYEPFLIWRVAPWHGKYVNTDDTPYGMRRRTINPTNCEPSSRSDVWVFGGSTVFGTGVPDWATLPSLLSRELNSHARGCVVVTNFGNEGYVSNQEVILLMEQLKAGHRPNIVVFYDGVNDSYAGVVSPGIPTAHVSLANIKARVEGSLAGRLDFLRNSNALQVARMAAHSLGRSASAASPEAREIQAKAAATLDNYEANLRIVRALGQAYGFRIFCFWQPAFVYGHKPLAPFELRIADNDSLKQSFQDMGVVYQQAERRAAKDGTFIFLGSLFDSTNEAIYLDRWMHLSPVGNEIVAQSIAQHMEQR